MVQDEDTAKNRVEAIARSIQERTHPPVDQWDPPLAGDSEMRIARDGTWYHQGAPIRRPAMVALFAKVLRREEDAYYLVTPAEKLAITVEDAPFLAVEMAADGSGAAQTLYFRTNVDEWVRADDAHRLWMETDATSGSPRPYLAVRGGLHALIVRSVFYELIDRAMAQSGGDRGFGLWSAGTFFPLDDSGIHV